MSKRHPIKSYVRKAVFKEYDYTCAFCGKSGLKMSSSRADKRGAIDHIYPINKGGTNDYDNLQLLCTECNARKRDKTMDEFVEYMRRRRETDEMCERSEEHTSELQSRGHLVCRLLLEKKK